MNTSTTSTRTTRSHAARLTSPLVQDIKNKNPRLGIARIVRLIELQDQYASKLLDKRENSLAKPIWDTTLLSAFAWNYSYAPSHLWGSLENGRQTLHSVRSILGLGVI